MPSGFGDGRLRGRSGGRGLCGGLRVFGGFRFGGDAGCRFLGFAFLFRLALLDFGLLLLQVFLLTRHQLMSLASLGLARGDLLGREHADGDRGRRRSRGRRSRRLFDDRRGRVSLLLAADEHALLAHFHLDRARLAARVGRLDLGWSDLRVSVMRFLPSPAAPCCLRR